MARRKGFLVYLDYQDYFDFLTDEQLGIVIRGIFNYAAGRGNFFDDYTDPMLMVHTMLKNNYDRDTESYQKVCENRAEAAKKREQKKRGLFEE